MTGERVWWLWDGPAITDLGEGLLMLEEDKVLNPLSRKNQPAEQSGESPPCVLTFTPAPGIVLLLSDSVSVVFICVKVWCFTHVCWTCSLDLCISWPLCFTLMGFTLSLICAFYTESDMFCIHVFNTDSDICILH